LYQSSQLPGIGRLDPSGGEGFFERSASVAMSSVKSAVASDSWVPLPVDPDFVQLVCIMPSDDPIFDASPDFDPLKASASLSVVQIVHSLICLSVELESEIASLF
jgi:hypothetical protein